MRADADRSDLPGAVRQVGYACSAVEALRLSVSGLSVVPLYQIFQGLPTVDKIDLNQSSCAPPSHLSLSAHVSSALAFTGFVWSYYALLITPQNAGCVP